MLKEYLTASERNDYTKGMTAVEVITKNHAADTIAIKNSKDADVAYSNTSESAATMQKSLKRVLIGAGVLVLVVGGIALIFSLTKPSSSVIPKTV